MSFVAKLKNGTFHVSSADGEYSKVISAREGAKLLEAGLWEPKCYRCGGYGAFNDWRGCTARDDENCPGMFLPG